MNIGLGSGDDVADVTANRALLRAPLPSDPRWLNQVHGARWSMPRSVDSGARADASFTDAPNVVCVVSIADCMPVLLTDASGRCCRCRARRMARPRGGCHPGDGASRCAQRLDDSGAELIAYLGPAIGPRHFEVGAEVLDAMQATIARRGACVRARAERQVSGRSVRARAPGA